MPDSTFSNTNSGSGSSLSRSVVVSGISGTVTNVRYEIDFSSSNWQYIGAYVSSPNSLSYIDIITTGSLSGSGSTTQGVDDTNSFSDANGTYDFTIGDQAGNPISLSEVRVIVTHSGSSGTNYQLALDDSESDSQASQVDVNAIGADGISLDSSESESLVDTPNIYLSRKCIRTASFW